jgi:uncharacterized MnhB-related membrane protein
MRPEPKLHPATSLRRLIAIAVASMESYLIVVEASDPAAVEALIGSMSVMAIIANCLRSLCESDHFF